MSVVCVKRVRWDIYGGIWSVYELQTTIHNKKYLFVEDPMSKIILYIQMLMYDIWLLSHNTASIMIETATRQFN